MYKCKKRNQWIGVIMLVIMTVLSLYPQGENGLCVKAAEKLDFTEGNSYIITSKESKKVIEVADFGTYNGDKLQQWDYSKEESQQWQVKTEGSYYKFINKNSKKVLSTEEGAKNGSLLFQWEDKNADTQLWYLEETKDGYVQIKSKANKKCIDIAGISKDNGAKLQLWEDVDGDNQKWKFTEIKENKKIVSGAKYKILSKNSKKAVETAYHSQKNGEVIQQWEYNDGESQQWYLEAVEDRYFKIINAYSGKAMTISGGNINNGTKILQNEYEEKDTQLWYFSEDANGYFKIKSKRGHKCLEVSGISKENGAKLQLWDDVNGDNQKWNLQLLEYQAIPYIDVDMYYNYNNNTYEVKWSGSKKITLSELYIRKNNSQKFEKYTTKEEKDEINEDDEKYYLENIKSDSGIRYMDIKIVGTSISGEK